MKIGLTALAAAFSMVMFLEFDFSSKANSLGELSFGVSKEMSAAKIDEAAAEGQEKSKDRAENFTFTFPNIFDIFRSIF